MHGFAGSQSDSLIKAVKWYVQDDEGRIHAIVLPNIEFDMTATMIPTTISTADDLSTSPSTQL